LKDIGEENPYLAKQQIFYLSGPSQAIDEYNRQVDYPQERKSFHGI